jgi:trehalose synthase
MELLHEARVGVQPLERFRRIVGPGRLKEALAIARSARNRLAKRVVWNLSSTAVGGGVAEMLQSLLTYTRGLGIDTRWLVIGGTPEFFRVTKRLHHALHGSSGGGVALDAAAHRIYEETLERNARELSSLLRPGDVVILHDPQTAGLARSVRDAGAHVIWRCHIGRDGPDEQARQGWEFLCPYLEDASFFVFSRKTYVPEVCDHGKSVVIQPSIDAFSPKNQSLSKEAVRTILVHTGLVEGPPPKNADHGFRREDGTPGRVERRAEVVRLGRPPAWNTPLVVQVSRWDPLKDMQGVMQGFVQLCDSSCPSRPELVLAGPEATGVTDDPEAAEVLEQVVAAWRELPQGLRNRIHLVSLPTADIDENGAIVNALQRHASVIVQKSLQEGFGLTVTEGMWKARPVVASGVGGILDQIEDGVSGILLEDPTDLGTFSKSLCDLLCQPERMQALGRAARDRVRERFLGLDHLLKYAALLERIDES